jgi:hypothetical protein
MTARSQSSLNILMTALVVLAVALRSLIPAGMMPEANARAGLLPLVICTVTGPATIMVDASKIPVKPGDHAPAETQKAPCLFAASFAKAVFSFVPQLSLPIPAFVMDVPVLDTFLFQETSAHAYFSQGPPAGA